MLALTASGVAAMSCSRGADSSRKRLCDPLVKCKLAPSPEAYKQSASAPETSTATSCCLCYCAAMGAIL